MLQKNKLTNMSNSKQSTSPYYRLENSSGSHSGLLTIKTGKNKQEMIEEIRNYHGDWLQKFPEFHNEDQKIDMAIVIHRKGTYIYRQDLDNIAKVFLDALKGYLFYDDAQIVRLLLVKEDAKPVEKYYGDENKIKTDQISISFRKYEPEKQMILISPKYI